MHVNMSVTELTITFLWKTTNAVIEINAMFLIVEVNTEAIEGARLRL